MKNWFSKIFSRSDSTSSQSDSTQSRLTHNYQKGDLVRVSWGANRGQIGRIIRVGKITDSVYVEFDGVSPGYWVDVTFIARVDTLIG